MVTLAELETDPYPVYARLRVDEPVTWVSEARQWLVTRWQDVHTLLTDVDRFTTDQPGSPMLDLCGGTPLLMREGASHQDVRESFRHDFDPHRVSDFVDTIARPVARRVADEVFPAGHADLAADYFEPVAATAMCTLLGLDTSGTDAMRGWGHALTKVANNFGRDPGVDRSAGPLMAEDKTVTAVVDRLREHPDQSVTSHLLHHDRPGDARPDTDVVPVLKHLGLSVIEPGWLASWTLVALWSAPDHLAAVRTDRALLGAAVYEALRWSSPVGVLGRRTTSTVTIAGTEIPANSMIAAAIASANRDETIFPDPDRFDPHRDVRTHLGFGTGPHHCPAHPLVTALARTALDVLLDRIPDARPTPGWQATPHGWKLRPPGPLNAEWDTSRTRTP